MKKALIVGGVPLINGGTLNEVSPHWGGGVPLINGGTLNCVYPN